MLRSSQEAKASDFDSDIRWFDPSLLSQILLKRSIDMKKEMDEIKSIVYKFLLSDEIDFIF